MRIRAILLLVVGCLVVASCGAGDSTTGTQRETEATTSSTSTTVPRTTSTTSVTTTDLPATEVPSAGQGCDVLHEPGEYEGLNVFDDVEQPYWVVVPRTYPAVAPAPLYLWLAPLGGNHDAMLEGWRPYLDDLDGLMVMVNMEGGGGGQDVLLSLIDQLSDDYCVDASRVHVTGSSWSSLAADRMACEAADRIASFSAMGGFLQRDECTPSRPVPLWTFTGDPDRTTVIALVDKWVAINGCDPDPVVEDLGSGVSRKIFQNCEADVVFYDIEGMGHVWPVHEGEGPWVAIYEEVDYLQDTLRFFAEHPLP